MSAAIADQKVRDLLKSGHHGAGKCYMVAGGPEDVAAILQRNGIECEVVTDPNARPGRGRLVLCVVRYAPMSHNFRWAWIVGRRTHYTIVAQAIRDYGKDRRARLLEHRRKTGDPKAILPDPFIRYAPSPCIIRWLVAEWCDDGRLYAKGLSIT